MIGNFPISPESIIFLSTNETVLSIATIRDAKYCLSVYYNLIERIKSVFPTSIVIVSDIQEMSGPVINPSSSEITLQSGQNYTLYCKGKRPVRLKQQEVPEEVTGLFNSSERVVSENESEYEVALDLFNVDQFAVGYYACFDNTVNSIEALNNIIEEPVNTPHVSYIYIYVNGES